jgi:hypothetical protein
MKYAMQSLIAFIAALSFGAVAQQHAAESHHTVVRSSTQPRAITRW